MGLVDYLKNNIDWKGAATSLAWFGGSYLALNWADDIFSEAVQNVVHTISPLVSSIIGIATADNINHKPTRILLQCGYGAFGLYNLASIIERYDNVNNTFPNLSKNKGSMAKLGLLLGPFFPRVIEKICKNDC